MSTDVTLPALGESVTEGTVTRWLKAVGDTIAVDEPLLEVSTDKVDTEIPSPVAGTLLEIVVAEDDVATVGAVLARIGAADETGGTPDAAPAAPAADAAPVAESAPAESAGQHEPQTAPEPEAEPAEVEDAAPEVAAEAPATVPADAVPAEAPAAEPAAAEPSAAPSGASRDVTLPALGESVTEGTVTRWLKAVGDTVAADEALVEVSTDKVDTEIPSPFAGTLTEILVAEDEVATVGTVLARIGDAGATAAPAPAGPAAPEPVPAPPAAAAEAPSAPPAPPAPPAPAAPAAQPVAEAPAPAQAPAAAPAAAASAPSSGSGYATPIVRKLANERGVSLAAIAGTGVGGRIRKEDVIAAAETPATAGAAAPAAAPSTSAAAPPAPLEVSELRGQTVKMTRIRKVTGDKMMESLHGMAQLTSVVEVDCSKIWALRAASKDAFQAKYGVGLSFLPFFTVAAAEALAKHANVNASIVEDSIVYHPTVNLSLAVDTEKGLMLPTLRDADSKSLPEHAQGIADLAARARSGGLKADEISGGTFSVTNTGSLGTLFDTPVVPAPQGAILATCAIVKRAVVVRGPNGEDVISVRPVCYLPLSYDHRLIDGADAARFLQDIKKRIEAGAFESDLGL